ncbi:carbamoyl-phosphate synthase large subunit [Cellulomonas fimi]|uniref:Carbamoyl phosphate synthase large chain n=1 Tax=Cellulomonas fimi (strain ATCC 484 / DSM 20113 / JCM 1341 / CCUG 24087 / LMG 16345 / NBRC 15513 / NCIMB 8980 / NCTC 7547 / NRS-133) TaxID=590998 RepID=F4H060_CELFA|nr:carbamoyl-phosphate synthase large subunit [Cellulomonas fimi]AEE46107.1 carbamoyl-phosphate synthase, large subunit [Cellulomonas fimi ATCC 484]NNH08446.1 carbamoyl-phosphate synthase large subunit [Cellulomonas fimi]VEH31659.1 Carbamoyl-phosphate synthase large chain [Cellulomonas fimi]
MPRRTDISSVLVIGSGPIVIGQACEFDYSGTQACRVLKEEGLRVVLVNSNPATIMTDPEFADATYVEPITTEVLTSIIAKERPDAILPTLGGQTALNAAIALDAAGVLEEYGVELIGANIPAIQKGEDREQFKQVVEVCGGESARSAIVHTIDDALAAVQDLGYPVVVRPSFTMGGLGSGIAYDEDDLRRIVGQGLHYSPTTEVLLEESILGWKEYELELMRDKHDNVVVVCSIENVDPVGVHTGDSVTVAPALTLTDREYQKLRDIGIAVIREVGVDTGGCNIQFAVEPTTGRVVVIEMNPRVSRSSALASKATGFPIAKIAAKLAVGYTLDEIPNDITGSTPASFEPTLDYVVVKVPRFAFEKFPAADPTLTTTMKSVGEAMALGRNFTEALGKAMRSIDKKGSVFHWEGQPATGETLDALLGSIGRPTEGRLVDVQQVLRAGVDVDEVYARTGIDPWFLDQVQLVNEVAAATAAAPALTREVLAHAKRHGLSDVQVAQLRGTTEDAVRGARHAVGLRPVFKTVDTCAAEFAALTPYHYSSYDEETEVRPRERPAILILGSGPNRIGQGIEFDYSCVHAALALKGEFETVMVNCNPETVSTDYDTSDRLYFEPLTFEDVLEVYQAELAAGPVAGLIVTLGGQTPLSLAQRLADAGLPILGTPPQAIDAAEDRGEFGKVLEAAGLPAPAFGTATTLAGAKDTARRIGFPVLVRPSYVLGGRGMEIVYDEHQLTEYVQRALEGATEGGRAYSSGTLPPLLIDRFLDDAIEIDVDALFDGHELFLGGVMEHIEEAGIHSGDSACALPPVTLSTAELDRIRLSTEAIARGVGVRGLLNIQFALVSDVLYVLEANPRASRTVPFVSKATGVSLAKAAALVMAGRSIADLRAAGLLPEEDASVLDLDSPVAVKEAVLPFKRFRTARGVVVDTVLGPEMRSTGEVMGFDVDFPTAFAKSQEAAFGGLPSGGRAFISVADRDKRSIVFPVKRLAELGFEILATEGTAAVLHRSGIRSTVVRKYSAGRGADGEPTIVDLITAGEVDMVVNTPSGQGARADGYEIRAATIAADKAIVTTVQQLGAAVQAIEAAQAGPFTVTSLQEHDAAAAGRRAARAAVPA